LGDRIRRFHLTPSPSPKEKGGTFSIIEITFFIENIIKHQLIYQMVLPSSPERGWG
jgi:hypothetical protein